MTSDLATQSGYPEAFDFQMKNLQSSIFLATGPNRAQKYLVRRLDWYIFC